MVLRIRNPIALVTIPLALALSVIWFRRKKIQCDTGGSKSANAAKQLDNTANNNISNTLEDSQSDQTHSISVPIEQSPCKPPQKTPPSNRFGKSAPIDITPHKTSPKRASSDNTNAATDAAKADEKALNSIEESSSCESVDLPGSSNCRRRFSFTIRTNEPKVVVKATHMDARDLNKSPQSSFEQLTSPSNSISPPSPVPSTSYTKPTTMADKKTEQLVSGVEQPNASASRALPVASPPLSLCSNKSDRSQESGDSGKGDSISSPPNSNNVVSLLEEATVTYDFQVVQANVKFLVGKGGMTVRRIREQAKVDMGIKDHPIDNHYKWISLRGTQKQIDDALVMIKAKLPPRTNVDRIDMELEVNLANQANIEQNFCHSLYLIDGINNDVSISQISDNGTFYLHQNLHPSYQSLSILQFTMNRLYAAEESPPLPDYRVDSVCAGNIDSHWYRLSIHEHKPATNTCIAKYLDFGGYCEIKCDDLRQIRFDCVSLPFQAIECRLSGIRPIGGVWPQEATDAVLELTQQRPLQAQIINYEEGIPVIDLYLFLGPTNIVSINQELVAREYAEFITNQHSEPA